MIEENWDNTKLSSWQNCEQQGWYAHGYQGTGIVSSERSIALAWGAAFHAMVEKWCREPEISYEVYEQEFHKVFISLYDPVKIDILELQKDRHSVANASRLFREYQSRFPLELYKTIRVEEPFRLLLGQAGDRLIYWTGILDRIVQFQERIYFLELKTSSYRIDEKWAKQFRTSGQLRGYVWAGQQLLGKEFDGAIIHGVEKGVIPKILSRARKVSELIGAIGPLEILQGMVDEWKENTLRKITLINQKLESNSLLNMNLGDACNAYSFQGCPYRDLCGSTPEMRPQIIAERFRKRRWDPLAEERSKWVE